MTDSRTRQQPTPFNVQSNGPRVQIFGLPSATPSGAPRCPALAVPFVFSYTAYVSAWSSSQQELVLSRCSNLLEHINAKVVDTAHSPSFQI